MDWPSWDGHLNRSASASASPHTPLRIAVSGSARAVGRGRTLKPPLRIAVRRPSAAVCRRASFESPHRIAACRTARTVGRGRALHAPLGVTVRSPSGTVCRRRALKPPLRIAVRGPSSTVGRPSPDKPSLRIPQRDRLGHTDRRSKNGNDNHDSFHLNFLSCSIGYYKLVSCIQVSMYTTIIR